MVSEAIRVQRVQTGVRVEKRLLKVLKGLAEYLEMSLGDLLEGMSLHAFEGKCAFSESTLQKIEQLKRVYGMDYGSEASHRMLDLEDSDGAPGSGPAAPGSGAKGKRR